MTFQSTDKTKLSVLVVTFLLLVSAFSFLPAVGAFSPTTVATTGAAPASVAGATATIDYPILAGISTSVTRTITVANPNGNPSISSLTISVPKSAASVGPSSGTISAATSGVPGGVTVSVFGNGPWAVVYTPTSGTTLLPGGAAIILTLGSFTTETATATAGVADAYALTVSATDSSGATTNLAAIVVYETASTSGSLTLTAPSGSLTAGTPFTVKVSGTDSGLPLQVSASGSLSNNVHGVSATTTESPSSFTTGPSTGSTSVSVNDTTAETLTLTVSGGTPAGTSQYGYLSASTAGLTINAAAVTSVAIAMIIGGTTYASTSASKIFNVTSAYGLNPIAGGFNANNEIVVSTADKYGNAAPFGTATTVTVTAVTLAGQTAGFSTTASAYSGTSGTYPYAPSGGVSPSVTVSIGALATSVVLSASTYFFFGVDYGSSSYLLASSSGSGLASGSSARVNTYTLNAAAVTITPSTASPKAGSTMTLTATVSGVQQANVPVNFKNTTNTVGLFTNGKTAINTTTTISSNNEQAVVTFTPSTKAGATVAFAGKDALPGTNGVFAYNSLTGASGTITTVAGSATALAVGTYFNSGITYPTTMATSKTQLYVDANTTDAYGNPAPVSTNTQVTFSTSGGSGLSQSIVWILSSFHDTAFGSGYVVLFTPASSGSSFTISATATVGSSVLTGSATVAIVSSTPTLTLTAPTTITSGVPITVNGTAVVSPGVSVSQAPGYIKGVQYSLNGATNVTIVNGTSFTTAAKLQFQFSLLLTGTNNIIVYAEDNAGHWVSTSVSVPPVPTSQSFLFSTTAPPVLTTVGTYQAIKVNVTNNQPSSLSAIVFVTLTNSAGQTVGIFTASATNIPAGSYVIVYPVLSGVAHGTYTATIFVLSTSGVPLSPTTTLSVTL